MDRNGSIQTLIGPGDSGYFLRGGSAWQPRTRIRLISPESLAVDRRGQLYIADGQRILRWRWDGAMSVVAGGNVRGFAGDGGAARRALFNDPVDVAVDAGDNLYVADLGNRRIRKITPAGTIFTVAGGGQQSRDGVAATRARLVAPVGIAVDRWGRLLIADRGAHRVRRVGPDGTIATAAGTGERGFSGDGGPATKARLYGPQDVALDARGDLYIVGTGYNRIRQVDRRGIIHTVAGSGTPGFAGDGGPATRGALNGPHDVAVDSEGNLWIADTDNAAIRVVDRRGILRTAARGPGFPSSDEP
jgi:sugar lactone lactonase YvrE